MICAQRWADTHHSKPDVEEPVVREEPEAEGLALIARVKKRATAILKQRNRLAGEHVRPARYHVTELAVDWCTKYVPPDGRPRIFSIVRIRLTVQ
jgi:hypothetical protein